MSYFYNENIAVQVFSTLPLHNRTMLSYINKMMYNIYNENKENISKINIKRQFDKVVKYTGINPIMDVSVLDSLLFQGSNLINMEEVQETANSDLKMFLETYNKLYKYTFSKFTMSCVYSITWEKDETCIVERMSDSIKQLLSGFGLSCNRHYRHLYCSKQNTHADTPADIPAECAFTHHNDVKQIFKRTRDFIFMSLSRMTTIATEGFIFENIHEWILLYNKVHDDQNSDSKQVALLYNICKDSKYYNMVYLYKYGIENYRITQKFSHVLFDEIGDVLTLLRLLTET